MENHFDVVVTGAGVNGLMTTYHLSKNKDIKILLLEQFDFAHSNGSSHSQIRIIRSAYRDPLYVELTLEAKNKYWPQLEQELGEKFINDNPFIIFGDYEPIFNEYKSPIGMKGFENLRVISGKEAQEKYPEMKLGHLKQVIEDTNAGIIEARKAQAAVYKYLQSAPNVKILTNTKLLTHKSQKDKVIIEVQTNNEKTTWTTKKLMVTAGRWVGQLFPQLKDNFSVNQQLISYLEFDGPTENFQMGKFPTWMSFDKDHRQFWALPSFGGDGIKFGRHLNLMAEHAPSQEERLKEMREFTERTFHRPLKNIQKNEACYYTSTVLEDFIIEFVDEHKNVLLGSICSGHAFKFGPVMGFILSELIQNGKSSITAFQDKIHQFSIEYAKTNGKKAEAH